MSGSLKPFYDKIDHCLIRDRFFIKKQLQKIKERQSRQQPVDRLLQQLQATIESSVAIVDQRRSSLQNIDFPDALPVSQKRVDIEKAIRDNQIIIVAGETGSGKTTQLPKICLQAGQGVFGSIGHTQPRRIAARTVASRIAEELKVSLGEEVGYQVRFTDESSEKSRIKLMTDGILLAEIQNDRFLNRYDTIIIDEAHERSLNIDFLLGYLKQLLPKRPDLKIIVTSATIDVERLAKHFNDAPIIQVSGRTFPVDVIYQPPPEEDFDQVQAVVDTLEDIVTSSTMPGDVLVFMSGERDIRETALAIRKAKFPHVDILPLYARLSLAEQAKVFQPHKGIRVVLATNVAETSLTVPGIRYVIDPGTARISRYSYRTKVQRLPIEPISQASANQRKGRSGRVAEGVCYRLYSEEDFNSRPEFTEPEILRSNLASVILQMAQLRIGDIQDFPFVDPPDTRLINDGYKLLEELQAIDRQGRLTKIGRQITQLPVDPKFGRMCLQAANSGCLREVLIVVAALSIQDPRERPADKQQAADEKHRRFWEEGSDFLAYLNLWQYVEENRQALSQNQWRQKCKKEFLSFLRLREWRDLHHQLRLATQHLGLKENNEPANYQAIHTALLSGLLGNIGLLDENREYLGTRNRKFSIFPGSSQFKKSPKWMMCSELIETSKLYAHGVAKIEPEWILKMADHLVKRNQYEPRYDAKRGQVVAYEKVSLHGLVLSDKETVNFSKIDPTAAREIFIQSALVDGQYNKSFPRQKKLANFWLHNNNLLKEIHALEAKSRRRDILVEEKFIFDFYAEKLPEKIANLQSFEKWRKEVEAADKKLLYMDKTSLMQHAAVDVTESQFPNRIRWGDGDYKVSYHFEPGHARDGVSVSVPIHALHLIDENRLEWLVPGMLSEKCVQLVKALPKQIRKNFVPVPDTVNRALAVIDDDKSQPILPALAKALQKVTGIPVTAEDWIETQALNNIDDYYRFNINVINDKGKVIDHSRNLSELLKKYKERLQDALRDVGESVERSGIKDWDFSELPESKTLTKQGVTTIAYPALVDRKDSVDLKLLENPIVAENVSRHGICRLILLAQKSAVKYLQKSLFTGKNLGLVLGVLGSRDQLVDDLLCAVVRDACLKDSIPRTHAAYEQCVAKCQGVLTTKSQSLAAMILECGKEVLAIKSEIASRSDKKFFKPIKDDINHQLSMMFVDGFLYQTPLHYLEQFPRYLKAIKIRIEKSDAQIQKDAMQYEQFAPYLENWQTLHERKPIEEMDDSCLEYRWMLEEFKISLFAQPMKTRTPVSPKRLTKLWEKCKSNVSKP